MNHTNYHHRNRRVIIPDGVMVVGQIIGAHGLLGELKIEPHTDFAERFAKGNMLYLGEDLAEVVIAASRPHKGMHLLRIDGITNRTEAEGLRGLWLFIPEEQATPLADDVYWIHDMVGMSIHDDQGRELGVVRDILQTGANDVFLIDPADNVNQGREILLPAIAEVIKEVNLEERRIVVELLPGLLDEQ